MITIINKLCCKNGKSHFSRSELSTYQLNEMNMIFGIFWLVNRRKVLNSYKQTKHFVLCIFFLLQFCNKRRDSDPKLNLFERKKLHPFQAIYNIDKWLESSSITFVVFDVNRWMLTMKNKLRIYRREQKQKCCADTNVEIKIIMYYTMNNGRRNKTITKYNTF